MGKAATTVVKGLEMQFQHFWGARQYFYLNFNRGKSSQILRFRYGYWHFEPRVKMAL